MDHQYRKSFGDYSDWQMQLEFMKIEAVSDWKWVSLYQRDPNSMFYIGWHL